MQRPAEQTEKVSWSPLPAEGPLVEEGKRDTVLAGKALRDFTRRRPSTHGTSKSTQDARGRSPGSSEKVKPHNLPGLQHHRSPSLTQDRALQHQSRQPARGSGPMVEVRLDPAQGSLRAFYSRNKGLAYVFAAQFFGTLMNVTTRLLEVEGNHGAGMQPLQILFVRMTITTVLSTFYMWYTSIPHFPFGLPEVRWLLSLRGLGSFFGVFGLYYSLLYLPLADAVVITFISPSISCFACAVLLHEPFTRMEQLGALISFFGVTLIARPHTMFHTSTTSNTPAKAASPASDMDYVTSSQRLVAVGVALIGVLGQAMAFTAMRWIGKRAHPLLSVNYFSVCCMLVSGLAMAILSSVPFLLPATVKEWAYLIFLGICGFAMQFLLSAGLQLEKSSRATNMVYTQMLFALVFDKLVFGRKPTPLSLLGSTLILGSAIYVALLKERRKQKEEAEKARQQAPPSNGHAVEMRNRSNAQPRDEERGLVVGLDEDGEQEVKG